MAPAAGQRRLKTYREVVSSKRPAFTSTPVRCANSAVVDYERLLLPFTRSGQDVERIYCVVTLFAEDNLSPFAAISGSAPPSRD